jgi:ATP-dependent exoDNAse (exonuclease V) beta subunit
MSANAADALQATEPTANASVHASAGTGKTWLLTTRIIRLLLAGARPDGILAVTFTRKAAAEMQQRVTERLRELMSAAPGDLDGLLGQCGVEPTAATRERARQLYEELLFHPYPLRTTTFHAFCQELLQRFPLEAGVSPGFVIGESTGLLEQAARDALVAETAAEPDGRVARALDELVERCGGLASADTALRSFLDQRSDWWAWTEDQPDALRFASERLTGLLGEDAVDDPLPAFPGADLHGQLQAFAALLDRHVTRTNTAHANALAGALLPGVMPAACLEAVMPVFFKTDGEPRARKFTKAMAKALGEAGAEQLLELDAGITAALLGFRDRLARHNTLRTGLAWYTAGLQLLAHYQRIKQEQRVLDFADLEWRACELLNRSDHASWVQYKPLGLPGRGYQAIDLRLSPRQAGADARGEPLAAGAPGGRRLPPGCLATLGPRHYGGGQHGIRPAAAECTAVRFQSARHTPGRHAGSGRDPAAGAPGYGTGRHRGWHHGTAQPATDTTDRQREPGLLQRGPPYCGEDPGPGRQRSAGHARRLQPARALW